ncbi:tRNA (adenosine(37)-N6)-threonylcarbamoyltransferase complex dimerization subunit type 1 TsaB [Pontibacillus marinus]|uniref:Gcp-like domain-containing protein n=1 Tax=Pontibacillus marinus BH030004 = DSM 16465 TaxID=1385511 RepID=A0A0A5HKZ2_9BACI|nr:tRNA (adenosine(37)-N6)-threonylcarbamoyltransferase complex dimerization subunit type 1 TsaB [Pontibacillus marinus]KGX84307.1 hypothetical protein N783_17690 [Pontibacillus marinus BH030004 = DSM 16465]
MNVLAIDTSNQPLGVAVLKNSQVVAEYTKNIKKNHSVQLMPVINQLMSEAGLQPSELDRIAVANGPGSFTGIRIGLTTAKTLAWSLNIPIVAMSSLELLAYNGFYSNSLICPFFDARRGQVYTGLYQNEQSELRLEKEEVNILMEEWLKALKEYDQPIMFLSHDLDAHRETIVNTLGEQAILPDLPVHLPQAGVLAKVAMTKEPVDVHSLTPNYLRLAEAEAKWIQKQQES